MMVQVPLIVDSASGVNDYLDRDGSRTPVGVPHLERPRPPSGRRRGRAGGDEVEADGPAPVRDGPRRGPAHRHARRAQGLLPRPRPLRLRRPVGLGALDHGRGAHARPPHRDGAGDLEGAEGGRRVPARALPRARGPALPRTPRRARVPARRGHPRRLPRPAPQAARDADPPGAPGDLHLRDRLAARGRLPARAARRGLRRLVDRDGLGGRPPDARAERRHPRLEPGHAPPPRADVGRHPGDARSRSSGSSSSRASSTSSSSRTTRRS